MGTIFAIKRYAIHDGPNIRTTVFFKGCPLSCWWCHNPEGIDPAVALVWDRGKCVGCSACLQQCPSHSLVAAPEGVVWRRESCLGYGGCVEACPALALEATGREASVDEVMTAVVQDQPFFDQSGGGVTFSGGEPLAQPEFLLALLKECGRLGIHRAVDTSGFAPADVLLQVVEEADLFLFDLKLMDRDRHRLFTGVSNAPILDNLRLLAERGMAVQVRLPLIAGVNDDVANLQAVGAFVAGLPGVDAVDLLPYHGAAAGKYRKLNLPYKGEHFAPAPPESLRGAMTILQQCGLAVRIGG
jgi:pyruvate formate lyase activating enzyme